LRTILLPGGEIFEEIICESRVPGGIPEEITGLLSLFVPVPEWGTPEGVIRASPRIVPFVLSSIKNTPFN
jgi:hypothetical protein